MSLSASIANWLRSKPDLEWNSFATYGDKFYGDVWFDYIGQISWGSSLYDTRLRALAGDEQACVHITNYYHALVAAQLQGT